jgi:hypothetical protein
MHRYKLVLVVSMVLGVLGAAAPVRAQADPEYRWSFEIGLGWDKSISGNINSSAIGTLNNQTVVILKNSYEDVYGTGLHFTFGGGRMLDEATEVRAMFTFQSHDADLTRMGDIGVGQLYAQYDDYQSVSLDFGLRRYVHATSPLRPYADAALGIAFIDRTNVILVAPQVNLAATANDFYDRTAAFSLGANVGLMWQLKGRTDVFGQLGIRYMTGMSEVDDLVGTGLDTMNDKSARWTLPVVFGVRARF